MAGEKFCGVLAPVVTPFDNQLSPDGLALSQHCKWLIANGVGLAVFGTNSEANSLAVDEKIALLDLIVANGVDVDQMMPGTGSCALPDVVRLTTHAVNLGCRGVLMLPPFYYKGVSDDGLFAFYSEVIERIGDSKLKVYLYHIPPITQIPLSLELIDRLVKTYPATVVGIKDSSGDWSNTKALLDGGWDDFRVFCGSESFLLDNMRHGGAGCISATANVNPNKINLLYENWKNDEAGQLQADLNRVRQLFQTFPMIPALKSAVAIFSHLDQWNNVRPPLVALKSDQIEALRIKMNEISFDMPNLGRDYFP